MKTAQMQRCLIKEIIWLSFLLVVIANYANANGFDDKDFSLRFPAALNRFSSYADAAATGGASAGSKWQSSVNPASTAWQNLPGSYQVSLNPQYSSLIFQEGAVLHVISESVTKEVKKLGTFQVSLAQVRSNDSTTRQDIKFSYEMDYVQIQWGKRLSDDFALGGNFNYSTSKVSNNIDTAKLASSSSDSFGLRIGTLYRVAESLLAGLVVDYSRSLSKTTIYDSYGSGVGDTLIKDKTKQFSLRTGPSYEYRKDSTVNLDYQYCSLENDSGKMELHRMFAGIDHRVVDALFVRGGVAVDNKGNISWTGGLGIYPLKQLSIDLGYQYNMFPEIQSEFGRSHLATISISMNL